jgi:hypothetical protein
MTLLRQWLGQDLRFNKKLPISSIARAVAALAFLLLATAPAAAARCDELWAAAMSDDVPAIARLVNAGENVNCRDR